MDLFEKFSIKPNNKEYYKIAFTHSSYAIVHGLNYTYERLEFLGDSILGMLVAEYLYKKYPKYEEGKLTKLRANFVCQSALIHYSQELGLKEFLKVSADELNLTENEIQAITSDIFESFLGALFLDQGLIYTKRFISKIVFRYIDEEKIFFYDYKSKLKEYCDLHEIELNYEVIDEKGVPHDKTFTTVVYLNNKLMGEGLGKNKKESEQAAAKEAMAKLR